MAIKRIPDVLASPEQAKRVLREVAILRRLQHDNVIGLHDAFTQPSSTGKSLSKRGQHMGFRSSLYYWHGRPSPGSYVKLQMRTERRLITVPKDRG